jgi:hypothetical protein
MLGNQSMFPSVQFLPGGTRDGHKVSRPLDRRPRCNRIPAGDPRRCAAPASSRAFREGRAPKMGFAPACPWQVRCIMGDFPGRFLGQSKTSCAEVVRTGRDDELPEAQLCHSAQVVQKPGFKKRGLMGQRLP